MLTILVGNEVMPDADVDLDTSTLAMLPKDMVAFFKTWRQKSSDQVVRVYTDTIINYIGEAIENGLDSPLDVTVVTYKGTHRYTKDGVLDSSWPYGIFNYS